MVSWACIILVLFTCIIHLVLFTCLFRKEKSLPTILWECLIPSLPNFSVAEGQMGQFIKRPGLLGAGITFILPTNQGEDHPRSGVFPILEGCGSGAWRPWATQARWDWPLGQILTSLLWPVSLGSFCLLRPAWRITAATQVLGQIQWGKAYSPCSPYLQVLDSRPSSLCQDVGKAGCHCAFLCAAWSDGCAPTFRKHSVSSCFHSHVLSSWAHAQTSSTFSPVSGLTARRSSTPTHGPRLCS